MAQTLSANINGTIANVAYNDLYLDQDGNISISRDLNALIEECAQVAKTLLGECIYNVNIGIPYQQAVWIGVPNPQQFNASLRNAFLNINGVVEVVSLIVIQNDSSDVNSLAFNASINTIYGIGTLNG